MQNKIPLVVFLAGILSKTSGDPYIFILIKEPKTWTEAQSYCRETYEDLATVESDEDRAKLQKAADAENFASDAWIGLYKYVWVWSYENKTLSIAKWDSSEPHLPVTDESCGAVYSSQGWADRDCSIADYFFCQTDRLYKPADKFEYIQRSMTWHDAVIYCRKYYVDLAVITDDTENAFLADELSYRHDISAWIGLHRIPPQWQWSDNSSVSGSMNWQSEQPDDVNECVRANTEALMAMDTCSTPLPFYCRENRRMQRVRFTVRSDGLLDQSAVKRALEEKMKQILSDQNLKIKSSITWSVQPDGNIFQTQKTQQENIQETCEPLQSKTG